MSRELFGAANAWLGHRAAGWHRHHRGLRRLCRDQRVVGGDRGHHEQVAQPEMRRSGYDPGLAAGVIAAGGTLGIMIPPSVIFVLYGFMTETDIGKLFFAGVVPGLLAIILYMVVDRYPRLALSDHHAARARPLLERAARVVQRAVGDASRCSSSCSAACTAASSPSRRPPAAAPSARFVIGIVRGGCGPRRSDAALIDTLRVSSAIMMIVIGAILFGYFLTITQITQKASVFLTGCRSALRRAGRDHGRLSRARRLMDELAMILLTVPIVFPVMMQLGLRPDLVRRHHRHDGDVRADLSAGRHERVRH